MKRRVPKNDRDPSGQFFKVSNMVSISLRKHEMDLFVFLVLDGIGWYRMVLFGIGCYSMVSFFYASNCCKLLWASFGGFIRIFLKSNSLINRLLMVHGSCLMAQGSRLMAHASRLGAQGSPRQFFLDISHEP